MNRIRNIFLDVDGTLTDGKIYYSSSGEEWKAFDIKDGLLLAAMVRLGYHIVIITGRRSNLVDKRMGQLGITEIYQGVKSKKIFFDEYIKKRSISAKECCYIGDDLNDFAVMQMTGYKGCPINACTEIKETASYISEYRGGEGAVRDILEHLLKQNNEWNMVVRQYE